MNGLFTILLCAVLYDGLDWRLNAGESPAAIAAERARQAAVELQQTRIRVEELTRLERELGQRKQLEARSRETPLELYGAPAAAWETVLQTNTPVYQRLRAQAVLAHLHSVPCTICDGRGSMPFCVVCDGSGKCFRCKGTGQLFGDRCQFCHGTGKCYLCFGTGKMTCPFCDDGDVYSEEAPPPATLPLPGVAVFKLLPQQNLQMARASRPPQPAEPLSPPQPAGPIEASQPAQSPQTLSDVGPGVVLLLGLVLAGRKLAPLVAKRLVERFDPWTALPAVTVKASRRNVVQEELVSEFLAAFRVGPHTAPVTPPHPQGLTRPSETPEERTEDTALFTASPLEAFLAAAPERLQAMRKVLQEICHGQEEAAQQEMLSGLVTELRHFKGMAGLPELLPVWQMAYALECLVQQLSDKASRVTPSTLRTVAAAMDLLEDLARPGLRPDLCINPPIRTMTVDDDPISRHAVAISLRKGVGQPDVAADGPAALALVAQQQYDVLFLDVQMPGMDGFELCSKIHQTALNRTTPVVFVTVLSDFDARAKSTLSGGNDLIGKPFLAFEITVKALTLALRSRFQASDSKSALSAQTRVEEPAGEQGKTAANVPVATSASMARLSCRSPEAREVARTGARSTRPTARKAKWNSGVFFAAAQAQLGRARELVQQADTAGLEAQRQEAFASLYLLVDSISPEVDRAELHPVYCVVQALKGLLRKLLEDPKHLTESTLPTLATTVELLQDLCRKGLRADLVSTPPIRMLVVDDDPIARRAMSGALQTTFGRPDCAADGQTALAVTVHKPFDVIFLDVMMPGMDGFATCLKIRETVANQETPVVFVTSNGDAQTRERSAECGGNDFITKPFLAQEMTLKALTFALRRRRQISNKTKAATRQEQALLSS